jgi:hypothetical protein
MASKIEIIADKMYDRGPKYGFIEVQVSFEEKSSPSRGMGLANVIVPLAKVEVGSMSFDEIRVLAVSRAFSFMRECVESADKQG